MSLITASYLTERRNIGIMGILLPLLCWASCLCTPDKPDGWWGSMSATYHTSPVLAMGLAIVGAFLFSYQGYDKWDRLVNRISAGCALIVALFPCSVPWIEHNIGIFYLNPKVSDVIHAVAAIILFLSFMVNIAFNFTKGNDIKGNKLYKIIAGLMVLVTIAFALEHAIGLGYFKVFWYEAVELLLFGTAWLYKGKFLKSNLK